MNTAPFTFPSANAFPAFDQFPQGMDFLKQVWAQGLMAQTSTQAAAPSANVGGSVGANFSATPGLTQPFQQAMAAYLMPTFDVAELDKRISDMRTVMQFMELNTQMLRQSLQALEVQRNTVAALHSMMQTTPTAAAAATTVTSTPAAKTKKTRRKNTA